jgi:acyl carrier protein
MSPDEARRVVLAVLGEIAPEIDPTGIDDDVDLTEQIDLDSMDYLTWMIGISESTGTDIPQRDVSQFLTLGGAIRYLAEQVP